MHVPPHVVDDYEKRKMTNQPPSIRPPDMVMARQTIAFWDFPKPLIMAVNGLAVGGGANIALANYADMVICSTSARFKYPFSTLGLTPELGSSSLIPFVVGMAKAKEIMMIGVRGRSLVQPPTRTAAAPAAAAAEASAPPVAATTTAAAATAGSLAGASLR